MDNKLLLIPIALFATIIGINVFALVTPAQATGCPTNFVQEHIDNALTAFQSGDAKEVKNQLDLAKEALSVASEEKE